MLRITNNTNRQISINNYRSLKPHETADVDIAMNDNLSRLRKMKLISITDVNITSDDSNETHTRSRRSKKNLESESE